MNESLQDDGIYRIDGREPALKRALFLAGGLACIIAPTWELRRAFVEPGWWTLFFGVIVAGAWAVGLAFVVGAVAGEGLRWRFEGGVLRLERRSLLRQRQQTIRAEDVVRIEIRQISWDSRADSFSVVLHLRSGERLETPDYGTAERARSVEGEIRRRLGLA